MMKYEIKKVFSRASGKISLLLLVLVMVFTCTLAVDVHFVNENGVAEKGYFAVRKLRSVKKEWAGVLDEEKIRAALLENARIENTPEGMSDDFRVSNIAYGWKQGFSDIRDLINSSFSDEFRTQNYYLADSLGADVAGDFYPNRIALLKSLLYSEEIIDKFSEAERIYLITKFETLKTPLYYDYSDGWQQLFEYSRTIIMFTMMIAGFLTASIFSSEFGLKADSIFYAAYYGRNKAVRAKLAAGLSITSVMYWICYPLYSLFVLSYLGFDGAGCAAQANWTKWKMFYHLTNIQEYLLIMLGGFLGCLFISLLTMLVSAKTKSTVLATIVPFVLLFLPSIVENFFINASFLDKLLALLPDRLLQLDLTLLRYDFYDIFGKVTGAVPILFLTYTLLSAALVPAIYQVYRKNQAG